jgi:hypothetical protein
MPVLDSLVVRLHNDGGVKHGKTCLLVALACLTAAYGQANLRLTATKQRRRERFAHDSR